MFIVNKITNVKYVYNQKYEKCKCSKTFKISKKRYHFYSSQNCQYRPLMTPKKAYRALSNRCRLHEQYKKLCFKKRNMPQRVQLFFIKKIIRGAPLSYHLRPNFITATNIAWLLTVLDRRPLPIGGLKSWGCC